MGALALVEARPPQSTARGHLAEGFAVMRINGRVVMIDTNAHEPDGKSEYVVSHWHGEIAIDVPTMQRLPQYRGQTRLHSASPVMNGSVVVRAGVVVLGRVVREY